MMKTISYLSLVVVSVSTAHAAPPDVKPNVAVEPFLASWCAKQFPEALNEFDGYSMLAMMASDKHEKIEPYVGDWCFDQFPQLDVLDKNEAINNLYESHKQLEPFLEEWGQNSMELVSDEAKDHLIDIEPYIGAWCAEQYPEQLGDLVPTIYVDVQESHVKFEPAMGVWCFAQFPEAFRAVNMAEEDAFENLKTNHQLIEDELIKWTMTTNSMMATSTAKSSSGGGGKAAIIVLSILLVVSWGALLFVSRHRLPCGKKEYDSGS